MYSKIEVSGYIKVDTGLHIGGSDQFSAIGSVDITNPCEWLILKEDE